MEWVDGVSFRFWVSFVSCRSFVCSGGTVLCDSRVCVCVCVFSLSLSLCVCVCWPSPCEFLPLCALGTCVHVHWCMDVDVQVLVSVCVHVSCSSFARR